jgi:Uma2 family endonuclease
MTDRSNCTTFNRVRSNCARSDRLPQQCISRCEPLSKRVNGKIIKTLLPLQSRYVYPDFSQKNSTSARCGCAASRHLGTVSKELPEEYGIEPDYCFYIDNWQAVLGKKRIDWRVDPPPDLALEIDVTSYSDVNDYLPYRVPEVWMFKRNQLRIHQLQDTTYQLQSQSRYFPSLNLPELDLQKTIDRCLQIAYERDTSAAIRDLRQQLNEISGH